MADITKCSNAETNGCTLKNLCYRYTATSSRKTQSYKEYDFWNNECNGFWKTETREDLLEQRNEEARERRKELFG